MFLPTIRQLQFLIALADESSFSRAAARCNVTQPTLSAAIKEVEKLLDVQLAVFRPLWRRVVLVVFCFGWSGGEYALGNPGWALFFLAVAGYLAHQFFIAFAPLADGPNDRPTDRPDHKPDHKPDDMSRDPS